MAPFYCSPFSKHLHICSRRSKRRGMALAFSQRIFWKVFQAVMELSQAFALAVPHEEALRIRDDVGFFQAVRAVLAKSASDKKHKTEQINFAIRQIVSRAVASDEVLDIFAAAGLKKPDISILSEDFLAEVR